MTVGRRRKRYVLLAGSGPIGPDGQREFTRIIVERFPDIGKRLIWLEDALIIKTDLDHLAAIKALDLSYGGTQLETRSVSGSISKLKRMVKGGA